jgi:hypothetical protein
MPRKFQLEYPRAMYHVMSCGDQREDIFLDDQDQHNYIRTVAAHLRRETTLSVKQIAECLRLGKPKGARTNLHKFMNGPVSESPRIQLATT